MKTLTIFGLMILLLGLNSGALAGDRGHGGKHGKQHFKEKGRHYQQRGRHHKHYRPYRAPRYYGRHYRPNYYYPSYLGAALIGSALNHSLYHTHNGSYCYDNHNNGRYSPSDGGSSEVVGCHRMERLPDGSERRVEVPLSECY